MSEISFSARYHAAMAACGGRCPIEAGLLGRLADGNHVDSLFEFAIVAPNGEPITCPVAEWATVVDGRIKEFRVYYDPRAFMSAFGIGG